MAGIRAEAEAVAVVAGKLSTETIVTKASRNRHRTDVMCGLNECTRRCIWQLHMEVEMAGELKDIDKNSTPEQVLEWWMATTRDRPLTLPIRREKCVLGQMEELLSKSKSKLDLPVPTAVAYCKALREYSAAIDVSPELRAKFARDSLLAPYVKMAEDRAFGSDPRVAIQLAEFIRDEARTPPRPEDPDKGYGGIGVSVGEGIKLLVANPPSAYDAGFTTTIYNTVYRKESPPKPSMTEEQVKSEDRKCQAKKQTREKCEAAGVQEAALFLQKVLASFDDSAGVGLASVPNAKNKSANASLN